MKKWFSNCFPLLYICLHCDEVCVCWHFGAPGTPGFYVGAQHDPENFFLINFIFFIFFILTQKVLIRLLIYLTCKLLLNGGYMWTKMGPVWIYCKTYYPLFFLVVHMYPVWCGLHDTLIPLDSTYPSPGPPKMKTKIEKNVHQINSIFYILLSFGVILRCLWGLEAYIYIMFMSSVDQCILI